MEDGIQALRVRRGTQQVTFGEVCDHLFDYVERHPEDRSGINAFARFLAEVEAVPHDHDADPRRGLPPAWSLGSAAGRYEDAGIDVGRELRQ